MVRRFHDLARSLDKSAPSSLARAVTCTAACAAKACALACGVRRKTPALPPVRSTPSSQSDGLWGQDGAAASDDSESAEETAAHLPQIAAQRW